MMKLSELFQQGKKIGSDEDQVLVSKNIVNEKELQEFLITGVGKFGMPIINNSGEGIVSGFLGKIGNWIEQDKEYIETKGDSGCEYGMFKKANGDYIIEKLKA